MEHIKTTHYVNRIDFLDKLRPHVSSKDLQLIEDAYTLSKYGHRNQLRDQGTRYFEHPKEVSLIIMDELDLFDPEIIIMALLHDIIEDSFILSRSGLEKLFGERVATGLNYLTKANTVETYVKKMRTCTDPGVMIVKFSDRLHNLRSIDGVTEEKKIRKLKETKKLFLPLLDNFIASIKSSSDLKSLQYLREKIIDILE